MSKAMDTCCPKGKPPASTTVSKVHSEPSDDARLMTLSSQYATMGFCSKSRTIELVFRAPVKPTTKLSSLSTRSVVQASPPLDDFAVHGRVGHHLVIADIGVVIVVDNQDRIASYIAFAIHCGYLPEIA